MKSITDNLSNPDIPIRHSFDRDFLLDDVFDSPCMRPRRSSFSNVLFRRKRCVFHTVLPRNSPSRFRDGTGKNRSDLISSVQCSELLGSGGFGSVYLGKLGTKKVAVKCLHSCIRNIEARNESFRAETRMIKLSHPNIVRILATSGDFNEPIILMEYAGDRNLLKVINDAMETLDVFRRLNFATDIASALQYIHQNCVVHLDVKPANIIISPKDVCKLADFGCSQIVEHGTGSVSPTQRSFLTGTLAYRAPELLRGHIPTTKADIYAFGITLWQMYSREQPYAGQDLQAAVFAVVSSHMRPRLPSDLTPGGKLDLVEACYKNLFCQCWVSNADNRPTADDLVDMLSLWKSNSHQKTADNL